MKGFIPLVLRVVRIEVQLAANRLVVLTLKWWLRASGRGDQA